MALTPEQRQQKKLDNRQRNRERHAQYMREWRKKNPDRWRAIASKARRKWKSENRDEHREAQREHRYEVRKQILTMLAGGLWCQSCKFDSDWRALQIDHIHGGGSGDPRTQGGNTNLWSFRNWLKENLDEGKTIYQVLCANCNWTKRAERKEHPGMMIPKDV